MLPQLPFVLLVLFGAAALFASDRVRMDLVGFGALTLLLAGGVLSVPEALAGFADPTVHMIAALFVVGGAVFETGLADQVGRRLELLGGGDPKRLLLTVLLATAALSAFLSSTGTVALMVPIVLALSRRTRLSPSKLMIPLAYATLLGGMLTLIATPPNIVVSNTLAEAGFEPFGFFDFTGPGLCLVALGVAFMLTVGARLLPERVSAGSETAPSPRPQELWQRYGLEGWVVELVVQPDSPLAGRTIAQGEVRSRYGVAIFAVRPGSDEGDVQRAQADTVLRPGQVLVVKGAPDAVTRFREKALLEEAGYLHDLPPGLVAAELLVPPGSSLVNKTIAESRLRTRFDVNVMAVFRSREVLRESVAQTTVHVGDLLLLLGTPSALVKLRDEVSDAILLTKSDALEQVTFRTKKAPLALLVVAAMLAALVLELTAPVVTIVAAALAMVILGCVDDKSVERSINWQSVLLIATILPMATALTKVGAIDLAVHGMAQTLGSAGPYALMTALFFLTALIGLFISNTATAVLVSPVAVQLATKLDVNPHALLMTVAIAASAAFVTPVSSPVNMLVVNAGGYKFSDFARAGIPLLFVICLGTLLVVPFFFPFDR